MSYKKYIRAFVTELLASFLFIVVIGLGTIASNGNVVSIALINGFTYFFILQSFGFLCGTHMNPLITGLGFAMSYLECEMMLLKFLAQGIGHVGGYEFLAMIRPNSMGTAYDLMHSMPRIISIRSAFYMEFLLTTLFVFSWCTLWDTRAQDVHTAIIHLGIAKALVTFVGVKFTGASFNLSKSFAISFYHSNFEFFPYFAFAQFLGTAIAYLMWTKALKPVRHRFPSCRVHRAFDRK